MTTAPPVPERRPLATREQAWAKSVASWLGRLGASPNGISTVGMIAACAAGVCLGATSQLDSPWSSLCFLAAGLLIFARLLANMFDGMVALETGKRSPVGELFNEIPDRVSDAAILIGAGYAFSGLPELGWATACLAVFIAYLRAEGKVAGAHQEYCGPMAKQQRMAIVIATTIGVAIVPRDWLGLVQDTTGLGVVGWALVVILVGGTITIVRRLQKIAAVLRRNQA